MGKPSRFAFDLIRRECNLQDEPLSRFLMIGDNLQTDIKFAEANGIDSLLVLSGVTNITKCH
jgi:arabinose operon protein AraL